MEGISDGSDRESGVYRDCGVSVGSGSNRAAKPSGCSCSYLTAMTGQGKRQPTTTRETYRGAVIVVATSGMCWIEVDGMYLFSVGSAAEAKVLIDSVLD